MPAVVHQSCAATRDAASVHADTSAALQARGSPSWWRDTIAASRPSENTGVTICAGVPTALCNGDGGILNVKGTTNSQGQVSRSSATNPSFLRAGTAFTNPRAPRGARSTLALTAAWDGVRRNRSW